GSMRAPSPAALAGVKCMRSRTWLRCRGMWCRGRVGRHSSDPTEAVAPMLPPPLTFPKHVAVGVKVGERLLARPRNRHHQLCRLQELIAGVAVPTDAWGSVDPRGAGVWQAAGAKLPAKIRDSNPL